MKRPNELFALIKSLSQHEKRYFKLQANYSAKKRAPDYILLFDAIDNMVVYDEPTLKNTYAKENFLKNLPFNKNYLLHAITKSMASFHEKNNAFIQLSEIQKEIIYLFKKGHYDLCKKFIKRGIELSNESEQFEILILLYNWEVKLHIAEGSIRDASIILEKKSEAIQILACNDFCKKIFFDLLQIALKIGHTANETDVAFLEIFYEKNNLNTLPKLCTTEGQYYFYSSVSLYYLLLSNHLSRAAYAQKAVEIVEKNDAYVKAHPSMYIKALNNWAISLEKVGNTKLVLKIADRIEDFILKQGSNIDYSNSLAGSIEAIDLRLYCYMVSGQIKEAIEMHTSVVEICKQIKNVQLSSRHLDLIYNMGQANFLGSIYPHSLDWLNKIISLHQEGFRDDLFIAAKLLSLIVHFELKNDYYLENVIPSTQKFLKNKSKASAIESALLFFLKNAIKDRTDKETLNKQYLLLQKKLQNANHNLDDKISTYIDIDSWVKSKLGTASVLSLFVKKYEAGVKENMKQKDKIK